MFLTPLRLLLKLLPAVLATALLGACGTVRVDSEVNAFSTLPPRAGPNAPALVGGYTFEALPSQQADAAGLAKLQGLAQQSLQQVGLQRDDAHARYSAQVNVRVQQSRRGGWDDTFGWRPWGFGYWPSRSFAYSHFDFPYNRSGFWSGYGYPYDGGSPLYRHEVQLVLRDLKTGQIVFESSAVHEGLWGSSEKLLPAMLTAVLQDFPNPPRGVRQVRVDLPNTPAR